MKTIFEHIEHVKGKPHHIRKRVALTVAGVTTGAIALIWLTGSLATGAFAIQGSDFAMSSGQGLEVSTTSSEKPASQGLAGAAAAAALVGASAPAHIEIVDTSAQASAKKQSDQTILPF